MDEGVGGRRRREREEGREGRRGEEGERRKSRGEGATMLLLTMVSLAALNTWQLYLFPAPSKLTNPTQSGSLLLCEGRW